MVLDQTDEVFVIPIVQRSFCHLVKYYRSRASRGPVRASACTLGPVDLGFGKPESVAKRRIWQVD